MRFSRYGRRPRMSGWYWFALGTRSVAFGSAVLACDLATGPRVLRALSLFGFGLAALLLVGGFPGCALFVTACALSVLHTSGRR